MRYMGMVLVVLVLGCASGQDEQQAPVVEATKPAESTAIYDINKDEQGLALRGNDAVAYYTDGKPIAGKAEYSYKWHDAEWRFASAENRDLFAAKPEQYAPSNGGWCTFGIVLRKKFDGDPQVWAIEDDQLYIFLNEEVRGKFLQDKEGNLQKVGSNWPYVEGKDAAEL